MLMLILGCAADGDTFADVKNAEELCSAQLVTLQKDAHSEQAGELHAFWPTHTTTQVQVTCGEQVTTPFMANHGTEPDQVDENGSILLHEVARSTPVAIAATDLSQLEEAYAACECQNEFLTMDDRTDGAAQRMLASVVEYTNAF